MTFDLRLPIGLLFVAIGALVGAFGLLAPDRALSLGLNVDLLWGVALLVAGAAFLGLALLARRAGARS